FVLYVDYENAFGAQGRNWLPFLLPFVLTGGVYVPKLFHRPRLRWGAAVAVLAGLLAFDGVGGYYAAASVSQRYYASYHGQPMRYRALTQECQSVHEKQ